MATGSNILLAFYGDDLTGSTDALEFISRAGAKTVLFLAPPTEENLRAFPGLQAYGIAGLTRSLPPDKMEEVLLPAFAAMKASGATFVHYKVCSTFDSSPDVGSIGKALDCGTAVFENSLVPVLGGTPALGRYCVFGNLFARMGTGESGAVYRLDRHPSMRNHPVTPATESDLRLHLGRQTKRELGLVDVVRMKQAPSTWKDGLQAEVVILDVLDETDLLKIGEWLGMEQGQQNKSLFVVGSSAVEAALGTCWNKNGSLQRIETWPRAEDAGPLLVLSGSCSPVTKAQIAFAVANGFADVPLALNVFEGKTGEGFSAGCDLTTVLSHLRQKKSVIVHTGKIEGAKQETSAQVLGTALGTVARAVCKEISLKRIVVAGGDTSSYAGRAMGIEALELKAPLVKGAPLCTAHAPGSPLNGVEVNFKGGQVGGDDYFLKAREGFAQ